MKITGSPFTLEQPFVNSMPETFCWDIYDGSEETAMDKDGTMIKKKLSEGSRENLGSEVSREVLISPSETGNSYLKMAYVNVPPGARGTPHVHLGEEVVFTLKGEATLHANGKDYVLEEGTAVLIPPDLAHPVRITSQTNWEAVAAYCDECPILKKYRNKEAVSYPLEVEPE